MNLILANNLNSKSSVIVRKATIKDLHGIVDVLTSSFYPPHGLLFWFYPLFKLGIYEDLRNRLEANRPYYLCLVATLPDETIIATVEVALRSSSGFSLIGAKYPYISNLAVKQAYRRQGIARKLLIRCEQMAWEWGYEQLSLHVLADNHQAQQLYFSRGYHIEKADLSLEDWFFNRPKKLLLVKAPDKKG
ncbi:MAG: GNAT family N-acetyltransferase [Gloeocapsa sp. DLM2.Bin57]|nr:MAG: GNAT family N-acetyltransferase [Gloeocapsa sp. DLM2.Bin57]